MNRGRLLLLTRKSAPFAFITPLMMLSSCVGDFARVQQDFHYSYTMQPGGHLDVETRNGSIDIVGWDRNSIDVAGTKYAPDDSELQEVRIKVNVSGNTALISTESPNGGGLWGNYGANYTIHVPSNTAVTRARSTNGRVSAEDLTAGGSLNSTNGHISLNRDTGNFDVHTTNGSIEFEDCSGMERAETTNGGVRGTLRAGAFDAHSVNGPIDFTLSKPQSDEELRASTTNGSIRIQLNQFAGNPMHLETTHGPITLRLPHDTDARIDARTTLARISSELPISAEESGRHELRGQLGKGGPSISAETTTGPIRIEDGGR